MALTGQSRGSSAPRRAAACSQPIDLSPGCWVSTTPTMPCPKLPTSAGICGKIPPANGIRRGIEELGRSKGSNAASNAGMAPSSGLRSIAGDCGRNGELLYLEGFIQDITTKKEPKSDSATAKNVTGPLSSRLPLASFTPRSKGAFCAATGASARSWVTLPMNSPGEHFRRSPRPETAPRAVQRSNSSPVRSRTPPRKALCPQGWDAHVGHALHHHPARQRGASASLHHHGRGHQCPQGSRAAFGGRAGIDAEERRAIPHRVPDDPGCGQPQPPRRRALCRLQQGLLRHHRIHARRGHRMHLGGTQHLGRPPRPATNDRMESPRTASAGTWRRNSARRTEKSSGD